MITIQCLPSVRKEHNITPEALIQIEKEINEKHSGEWCLNIGITDSKFKATTHLKTHGDFLNEDSHIRIKHTSEISFIEAASKVIEEVQLVASCSHDDYKPAESLENERLTNGMVNCLNCNQQSRIGFAPSIEGNTTIKLSGFGSSRERFYVVANDWGSVSIQGGDNGIVIGANSTRTTAFIEAFPTIDGIGTFIRGEGANIRDAENSAWNKYIKQMGCKDHKWSRTIRNQQRLDGYATCTECGLTGHALEPLTCCHICNKPTTITYLDKHICQDHHNELTFEELLDEAKTGNQSDFDNQTYSNRDTQHDVDVANFEEAICLTFKVAFRDEMLKRGLPYPIEESMLDFYFLGSFKQNVFEIESYHKVPMPIDLYSGFMAHNLNNIKAKMPEYIDDWCEKEGKSVSFSPLITGCYRIPFPKQEEK